MQKAGIALHSPSHMARAFLGPADVPLLRLAASCLYCLLPGRGLLESCSSLALASTCMCDLSPTIFGVVWGFVSSQAVGDMHARLKVNAHFFCLAPGLAGHRHPAHGAALLPVEDGILGIILEAVAVMRLKSSLKIIKVQVAVSLQVLLHGEKSIGFLMWSGSQVPGRMREV